MIKLIASDLDGTLLPPTKIMPEDTFTLIERLYERGAVFAPASGRQLPNLKKLFTAFKVARHIFGKGNAPQYAAFVV